jgi:cyanate permease
MTCVVGGLVMAVVGLPLAWFCLKQRRPEYYGMLPDGARSEDEITDGDQMLEKGVQYAAEVEEVEFSVRQVFRTFVYWLLVVINGAHSLIGGAIQIHTIPFLTDLGIDPLVAAGIMVVMIGSSVPARLLGGLIIDRIRTPHLRFVLLGAYLLQFVGIGIFLLFRSLPSIYAWYVLYGVGMGMGYVANPLLRARYFGRKAFGSIHGITALILTPFGVAAPVYAGWVYDSTGSYISAFTLFAGLLAISVVLIFFAKPAKPPEVIGDIRKIV